MSKKVFTGYAIKGWETYIRFSRDYHNYEVFGNTLRIPEIFAKPWTHFNPDKGAFQKVKITVENV